MTNDKRNINFSTVVIVVLSALVIAQYFFYKVRINSIEKGRRLQCAKMNFTIQQIKNGGVLFDSVYSKNDTIKFYNKDSFLGMTVIKEE